MCIRDRHNSQRLQKIPRPQAADTVLFSHIHLGSLLLAKDFYRRRSVPPAHKSCAPSTAAPKLFLLCSWCKLTIYQNTSRNRLLYQLHGNTLSLQVPFPTHKVSPVSYTHLDVYKRQIPPRIITGIKNPQKASLNASQRSFAVAFFWAG